MVIFDSTRRRVNRKPFAKGLGSTPRRMPYTEADLAWAAQNLNTTTTDYMLTGVADSILEERAEAFDNQARLDSGYVPC